MTKSFEENSDMPARVADEARQKVLLGALRKAQRPGSRELGVDIQSNDRLSIQPGDGKLLAAALKALGLEETNTDTYVVQRGEEIYVTKGDVTAFNAKVNPKAPPRKSGL